MRANALHLLQLIEASSDARLEELATGAGAARPTQTAQAMRALAQLQLAVRLAPLQPADAMGLLHRYQQEQPLFGPIVLKLLYMFRDGADALTEFSGDLFQQPHTLAQCRMPRVEELAATRSSGFRLVACLRPERHSINRIRSLPPHTAAVWTLLECAVLTHERDTNGAARLLIALCDTLNNNNQWQQAAEIAAFATRRLPANRALRVEAARHLAFARRHDDIENLLKPFCQRHPDNRVAQGWLALAALALGRQREAFSLFDRHGIQHSSDFLALLCAELSRLDPVTHAWADAPRQRLRELEAGQLPNLPRLPDDPTALKVGAALFKILARERVEPQHFSQAIERFEAMVPSDAEVLTHQASLSPARLQLTFYLGFTLFGLHRYDEALPCFVACTLAEPRNPMFLSGLGQTLRAVGKPADAVSVLLDIKPQGPDDFSSFATLGMCHADLGHNTDAMSALKVAFSSYFFDNHDIFLRDLMKRCREALTETAEHGKD